MSIFAIYKPSQLSSYQVIKILKQKFNYKKIGHGGTLDPLAEGVLVIATDKDTKKLSQFLHNSEKEYEAIIKFGEVSSTDDAEGNISKSISANFTKPTLQQIKNISKQFIGNIYQVPPLYSAIKYKGVPLYKLAKQNKKISLKPRLVFIKSIKILKYQWPFLKIKVVCGSGVYIRSLARDFGEKLCCGAYLYFLKRLRVKEFSINDAFKINDIINGKIKI
ncbi:MAG: tRNA pseudouridine(55) synthase TruB [Minisyncoccia bacterium]